MSHIRFLNGFTCCAHVPSDLKTGALCLLIETEQGLVLVDTGLGREDYTRQPAILRVFRAVTIVPLDAGAAIMRQIARLGHKPQDVRHIVLTHMHFDHCGGLPDFPHATVHVHRREYAAFIGRRRAWMEVAYVRRHIAHQPRFELYEDTGERWFDWPAIRLPFQPEMWLVPLFGHTRGHCGVAMRTEGGWLFHSGDAEPVDFGGSFPGWMVRTVAGPHGQRLQNFRAAHPEIRRTTGHMPLRFFATRGGDPGSVHHQE
jgi:glyoxylase-like metal-dependent hydrolase (beta-lactamase superfamily II)